MSRRGRVFVISGPSGGGKTTVVRRLRSRMPRLLRSVSVTTRPPRSGEVRGRDYRFTTPAQFKAMARAGRLLEWARVHGAYYGTPAAPIKRALLRGRSSILSIDVQGARQIHRRLGGDAVLIFLMPPSMEQLRQRLLRRRTESAAAVRRRLAAARKEMACARWYDHAVVNDRLEHTVDCVREIIRSAMRQNRRQDGAGGD